MVVRRSYFKIIVKFMQENSFNEYFQIIYLLITLTGYQKEKENKSQNQMLREFKNMISGMRPLTINLHLHMRGKVISDVTHKPST